MLQCGYHGNHKVMSLFRIRKSSLDLPQFAAVGEDTLTRTTHAYEKRAK
jgi:hypothetical protein